MAPDRASSVSNPATVSVTRPSTPINPDLSRPRLKQITQWIRDELDIHVAREGPDVLRPDDVLTLHETFIGLQHAKNITVSDLRATGIHKAVQDIAGVATRWPGRLCDDCDKIIDIWTAKFGRFSEIHPFLFGRGGRLEGIASVHEYSREALLKRWAVSCPEKIHPKRSHRLGGLGFAAGSWWINPLFAHHAGIIGLEACDGGTTYDKHGAYALLLKDTGELEASCESRFTYRVPQNDKGKFRLTSATPRSRDPVRVLRSHSINSIWGPKAGVRYEGLYSVRGWSIKQAKSSDTAGGQWKEGDILFDVRFERNDPTPMDVVTARPTATEVDDYAEYKRLRKISRDGKHKEARVAPHSPDLHLVAKAVPPIMPLPSPLGAPRQLGIGPPSALRKDMVKRLHFNEEAHFHVLGDEETLSPRTALDTDPLKTAVMGKSNKLTVPSQSGRATTHGKSDSSFHDAGEHSSTAGSNKSSPHTLYTTKTAVSTMPNIDIRQVAPWIDYDADLTLPYPSEESLIVHQCPIITQTAINTGPSKPQDTKSHQAKSREHLQSPMDNPIPYGSTEFHTDDKYERRNDGDFKGTLGDVLSPQSIVKRDKRKSVAIRGRNLVSKLFDGVLDDEDNEADGSFWETKTGLSSASPSTPRSSLKEGNEFCKEVAQPHPHFLLRPYSHDSPLKLARRNAVCSIAKTTSPVSPAMTDTNSSSMVISVPHEDPFIDAPAPRRPKALQLSVKSFMSQSSVATTVGSATCIPVLSRPESPLKHISEASLAEARLRRMVGQSRPFEIKVPFKNPFDDSNAIGEKDWNDGSAERSQDVVTQLRR